MRRENKSDGKYLQYVLKALCVYTFVAVKCYMCATCKYTFMLSVCLLLMCVWLCTEWIEEHSSAAAPLANYAPNHLETYRDPQVPPSLPPGPAGAKRKSICWINTVDFSIMCSWQWPRDRSCSSDETMKVTEAMWTFCLLHLHWKLWKNFLHFLDRKHWISADLICFKVTFEKDTANTFGNYCMWKWRANACRPNVRQMANCPSCPCNNTSNNQTNQSSVS